MSFRRRLRNDHIERRPGECPRLMVTLLHALRRRDKSLGLATLCGGGGVSMATALEIL